MLRHLRAATAALLVLAASSVTAKDSDVCYPACTRTVPLVQPVPLLPNPGGVFFDYRPAINAAATTIVFEREVFGTTAYGPNNLVIADLASLKVTPLVPAVQGSARADWCWRPAQPDFDGPIAFSQGENGPVFTMPPRAGAAAVQVLNSNGNIYPAWYPGCQTLALYALDTVTSGPLTDGPTLKGPSTQKVDVRTGDVESSVTGSTLWAGYPSVNFVNPKLVAFAGQQFTLNNPQVSCGTNNTSYGYDENCNYVYIADDTGTPPRVYPLDRHAPVNIYDPSYEGRAPTWSSDGKWIAFESNRTCIQPPVSNASFYQIYIQDSGGLAPARPVTECMYNAQHAKWYRHPVKGRTRLIVSVLAYPGKPDGTPGHSTARQISYLDVTAFVAK